MDSGALLIVFLKVALDVGTVAHLPHQRSLKRCGRIDAAVLEQMVHRDDFGDDRDVLSRVERHADLRQLDVEDRRRLGVEAGAVRADAS